MFLEMYLATYPVALPFSGSIASAWKRAFFGFIASQFVAVFLPRIITDDEAHALDIFRQHEHKHVPMRRSIMVRLGNTYAENADFFPV